ncbi:DUF5916 domain-containing protein [Bowmanella denitrificans]|uniref:DUF5916 domain-containing protein n=1 Tax=Bowmanella denitrificans TaxID=366582 RepID=A0ABP3GJ36_9ALTE
MQQARLTAMLGLLSLSVLADETIPHLNQPIELDGWFDEAIWQHAKTIAIYHITEPSDQGEAEVQTSVRVFENGEYLYLAFDAKDPNPQQIRAAYRKRDNIWGDDIVGVKIDTYGNHRLAYQFFANALGSQADVIENAVTGDESSGWDGHWQAVGHITEQGYQVEVAIPLHIMNFPNIQGPKQWAMEFVRFWPRNQEQRISSVDISHANECWVCQMPLYTGFADIRSTQSLVLAPALVSSIEDSRDRSTNSAWQRQRQQQLGLDLKWSISEDVTLNATLNPDFSQVEADSAQLAVNESFNLFFDEKRPFFTENADYFTSPWDLVHTRNLLAPSLGVKVTGRVAEHTFGLFVADDDSTSFIVPGNLSSASATLAEKSKNLAARYAHNLTKQLTLGAMTTYRQADDYANRLGALDLNYRFTEQDTLTLLVAHSETDNPAQLSSLLWDEAVVRASQPTQSDHAWYLHYEHSFQNGNVFIEHENIGEDFRADLGFMPQADWKRSVVGGGHSLYPQQPSWWSALHFYLDWDITHNQANELLEREWEGSIGLDSLWDSAIELGFFRRERAGPRTNHNLLTITGNAWRFDEKGLTFFIEASPLSSTYLSVYVEKGDELDLYNNRLSDLLYMESEAKVAFNRNLQLQVRNEYTRLKDQGNDVLDANLTDLRLTYQFSSHSALRLTMILDDTHLGLAHFNPAAREGLYRREQGLSSQLLYSYEVNPQTVFFLGYSEYASQNDKMLSLRADRRTAFMKMSYAWFI